MIWLNQESQSGGNLVAEKRVNFGYNTAGLVSSTAQFIDLDGTSGDEVATSTYSYETLGRVTGLAHKNGSVDLFAPYEWSYYNLHRITKFVSADGTSDYEYDKTSQLTVADHDYQTKPTRTTPMATAR